MIVVGADINSNCANCGEKLIGNFCHKCGERKLDYKDYTEKNSLSREQMSSHTGILK